MTLQNKKISCSLCHFEFPQGAHVCQGCNGDVVYGPTQRERTEATRIGAAIFGIGAVALVYGVPMLINDQFGTTISPNWGIGIGGLLICGAATLIGAFIFSSRIDQRMHGIVRTIRR